MRKKFKNGWAQKTSARSLQSDKLEPQISKPAKKTPAEWHAGFDLRPMH